MQNPCCDEEQVYDDHMRRKVCQVAMGAELLINTKEILDSGGMLGWQRAEAPIDLEYVRSSRAKEALLLRRDINRIKQQEYELLAAVQPDLPPSIVQDFIGPGSHTWTL